MPQSTRCDAEINADKVRIEWPVSIDNSKTLNETYRIQAVLQPDVSK
ncbi:MAG: hypothetical protein L0191_08635 [Acidobacteria bacterium]|nr:hypothetical protein [Acidobacteriota bacterium]